MIEKSKLKNMFSNLCCSNCNADFDELSIDIIREEEGLIVIRLICSLCKKSFGIAMLGLSENNIKNSSSDSVLDIIDYPCPITSDEVIDVHNFINNLDSDWMKYIPDKYKK